MGLRSNPDWLWSFDGEFKLMKPEEKNILLFMASPETQGKHTSWDFMLAEKFHACTVVVLAKFRNEDLK